MSPRRILAAGPGSTIVALLGPTNTGKTHRALERMQQFPTGMIGLPLRLLAREVYDRLTASLGERAVALITGEEKRIGAKARYFVCTVEAMPSDRVVDFVAVDEIQLAAHPERGHIFTQRLLHSRGRRETWFLGAETIRPLLQKLVPSAQIEGRARLSVLSGTGQTRLQSLPKRSAIIAFSVPEVYRLAQQLKHRKGGAAVVLGSLSPRARNAQVALYESGEVNYVVATDAIGMGLNLNIRHVAFASIHKFDGKQRRSLNAAELAQIAGRAGRHLRSGTFGTLAPLPALPQGLQQCIEEHRFPRLPRLCWRNADLCMDSLSGLRDSLRQPSRSTLMVATHSSSDLRALEAVVKISEVAHRAVGQEAIGLLWQVCQIPDYGQGVSNLHAQLVTEVFLQLATSSGKLNSTWLSRSLERLDEISGDVDALTARVSALRTWAYLCNQASWLNSPDQWAERCDNIERRLSEALHTRLVDQFVASGRATFQQATSIPNQPESVSGPWRPSSLEILTTLRKQLVPAQSPPLTRATQIQDIVEGNDRALRCTASGEIFHGSTSIAQLRRGHSRILPEVIITLSDLPPGQQLQLSRRVLAWSRDMVDSILEPLRRPPHHAWSAAGRGLLYQLEQTLGSLPSHNVRQQLALLTRADRMNLRRAQVFLGKYAVYCHVSCDNCWTAPRHALCLTFDGAAGRSLPDYPLPTSMESSSHLNPETLSALGYIALGATALRAPALEQLAQHLSKISRQGPFELPRVALDWLQCDPATLDRVLAQMGFRPGTDNHYRSSRRRRARRRKTSRLAHGD